MQKIMGQGPINNFQIEKKGLQNEFDTKAQAQETFLKSTQKNIVGLNERKN